MARERNRASSSSSSSASSSSPAASSAESGSPASPGDERSPVELQGLPGICGQSAVTRALTDALHLGRLHHAYLFDGPEGTGKATCARALFAAMNCQEPPAVGAACGRCESCYKLSHGAHPDLIPFDMSLSGLADEVERLIRRLQAPPFEGRAQMVILDPVDLFAMPTAATAANRLLKTLEEPRPNTHIVLVTTSASSLLPTLRSRCQRLRFVPLADDVLRHLLTLPPESGVAVDHGPPLAGSDAELDAAIALAQGSLGAAKRALADRERLQGCAAAAESLLAAARSGRATQMVEAASSAGADREQAQEILEHLWLRLQRELRAAVTQRQPPTAHSGLIAALRATRSAGLAIRGYTAAPLAIERMLRHVGDALSAPTQATASPLRGRPSHARE